MTVTAQDRVTVRVVEDLVKVSITGSHTARVNGSIGLTPQVSALETLLRPTACSGVSWVKTADLLRILVKVYSTMDNTRLVKADNSFPAARVGDAAGPLETIYCTSSSTSVRPCGPLFNKPAPFQPSPPRAGLEGSAALDPAA